MQISLQDKGNVLTDLIKRVVNSINGKNYKFPLRWKSNTECGKDVGCCLLVVCQI